MIGSLLVSVTEGMDSTSWLILYDCMISKQGSPEVGEEKDCVFSQKQVWFSTFNLLLGEAKQCQLP